jgi:hypothetical protein
MTAVSYVNQLLVVHTLQEMPIEYTEMIQARTHNCDLYILEQPSSCSTLRIRPSQPHCRLRLSLLLVSLSKHASWYHAQPSILLFISMGQVSHLMPSLLSGWLLTSIQVNNIITLYDTHGHTYIHHMRITILLFFLYFFHFPWQADWFRPFPSDTLPPAGLPLRALPRTCSSCPPAGRCCPPWPLPSCPLVSEA